jgi:hypothetical protein
MSDTNPHRPDCPSSYTGLAPCTKGCESPRFRPTPVVTLGLPGVGPIAHAETVSPDEGPWVVTEAWAAAVDRSTPERPGTAIFHAEYGPDGTKTAIRITRADRWIQVNREFVHQMRDEGELNWQPLTIVVGRPDSVMYRFDRKFDEHSDLYERVDDETPDEPDEGITDLDPEVAELLASNPPIGERDDARMAAELAPVRNPTYDTLATALARNRELKRVLNEALSSFTQRGNLGGPCVRTEYLPEHVVDGWRRTLARKLPFDEVIERVAGVELTDEQRAMVRTVLPNETDAPWKCGRCGSDRWNGWRAGPAQDGHRRLAQCVPCGQVQPLPADVDEA